MPNEIPSFKEVKKNKEVPTFENILYHNVIHFELKENEALDFFAPKSDLTAKINRSFGEAAKQIPEIARLISGPVFSQIKQLLLDTDDAWYANTRPKLVEKLQEIIVKKDFPETTRLISTNGDGLLRLRWLLEDQLKNPATDHVTSQELKNLQTIRDKSYFLTKENESVRGYKIISFDLNKLLSFKFTVYEADNNSADRIASGDASIFNLKKYSESLKKISAAKDCLRYKAVLTDDYDAAITKTIYSPYCPEYLILPPSPETLAKLLKESKDKLSVMAAKYTYIPPHSHYYDFENEESALLTDNPPEGQQINIETLNLQTAKDYRLLVNILFNEAIVNNSSL